MEARFVKACQSASELPEEPLAEVAVAGRSNCGKSSLINALTAHGKLARTSSTPGRTRELLFFRVRWPGGPAFHLVDLPGYGYAKVSRAQRHGWDELITAYIEGSPRLVTLLLLFDIRRGVEQEERDLLAWCAERDIEPIVALTKGDKLAKNRRFAAAAAAKRELSLGRSPLIVSTQEGFGIVDLRAKVLATVPPSAQETESP